MEKGKQVFY